MEIKTSVISADITMVSLTGSFDATGADIVDLEMRKVARSGVNIAVDLSDVVFITSQGIRILMMTAKIANASNKKLVLIGPKPPIRKVLAIMGVDKILSIYESVDAMAGNGRL